ncbi:MAG: TonB-dependent receptor [Proteobacteria bacterium SG_bin9]|nr:MAG: TonB-dependent receptor [Proteobacteria bacterium SG_bin9]
MRSYLTPQLTRPIGLLAVLLASSAPFGAAHAQGQPPQQLPTINVDATRLYQGPRTAGPASPSPVRSSVNDAGSGGDVQTGDGAPATLGIVGAATTVISRQEIANSPAQSIQEIIAQVPGAQVQTLFGGVNGARQSVDLRGFGAFATSNTLFLINGRRLNDLDLQGVELASIPRDSIERIEVTRGNSGAVLYGDNAVGGVINIVTRTGLNQPNRARIEGGFGSFDRTEGAASATLSSGPFSTAAFGNIIDSDGYRQNNKYRQRNGTGEVRYTTPGFTAFANLSGDDQHIGLPGGRRVTPTTSELITNRRGAATPFDFADQQGINGTAGFTKQLWTGGDLIVDGGVRHKNSQGAFFGNLPLSMFAFSSVDSGLTTYSITPRLSITNPLFGLPSRILTGIDYYDANHDSKRAQTLNSLPIHTYNLSQQSLGAYWQHTVGILSSTDVSYGGRIQNTEIRARDRYNPLAPGAFDIQATPLNDSETQHALHAGIEHRFNQYLSVFGRAARAFRTPNVEERIASGPSFDAFFNPIPQTFRLKTQTSYDYEGGVRLKLGMLEIQSSVYDMYLRNELQFDPVNFLNRNLDPTRRYGSETSATLRINEALAFRSGIAFTRAVFREGPFRGNDVPLVSPFTASGGVTWNIYQKYLVLDATARYWSSRRFDNDQPNTQPKIPANATVDLRLSGEYDRLFWSFTVNNLFDVKYYDYGIASAFTPGVFNAYPLPGRTFLLKAGFTL